MYKNIETYLKTIEWDKRFKREIPVLKEIIESINIGEELKILDIGCGPGKHLQKLAQIYPDHKFFGTDISSEMINYAQNQADSHNLSIKYIEGDINTDSSILMDKYDFIFSTGNSLALIWGKSSPKSVLGIISKKTAKGGCLFFQILNNDKPRQGYMTSKVIQKPDGSEIFSLKRFEPDFSKKILKIEFVNLTKLKSGNKFSPEMTTNSVPLIPSSEIKSILITNGFTEIKLLENYSFDTFNPNESDSLLCLAKKN
ncbi:MAG: class I SAM-dependent methyltransferase [archaeon]|nr:class I SAM-dependent methyltransferase [archaeon]